jgi:L-asparaginase/beta-aspartyl-peptidase (threonine type)
MYALIIHGGAGPHPSKDYSKQVTHMGELIVKGQKLLEAGTSALDVVEAMIMEMEACGLYVAGKGAAPDEAGNFLLDASIMTSDAKAGAVAAIPAVKHPISIAKTLLHEPEYIMLSEASARNYAAKNGHTLIEDAENYYQDYKDHITPGNISKHGTVGAVALDLTGQLAAGTSTGGTLFKAAGRIGDTPLIGAGTWADQNVAISSTGLGEFFIQTAAAHDVAAQIEYAAKPLDKALQHSLDKIERLGGDGGLIAVNNKGEIAMKFNSHGMKRAAVSSSQAPIVRVFEKE